MRQLFTKISRDASGNLKFNTGGLLTEASGRILTENSNVLNQERGTTKLIGWATDGSGQRFVTTNTPSSPLMAEGIAYDGDGAMHVSLTWPDATRTLHEGYGISATGQLLLLDASATILTEASGTLITEASDQIVAEAANSFTADGVSVTKLGQISSYV